MHDHFFKRASSQAALIAQRYYRIKETMRNDIYLMFATSFSMLITLGLYCCIDTMIPTGSIFEMMCLDFFHDSFMSLRCFFFDGHDELICERFITPATFTILYTVILILIFIGILCSFYGREVYEYMFIGLITKIITEYVATWFTDAPVYCKIDILTVSFFIWQLTALVYRWIWRDLASPILILEQVSFCVFTGLEAFMLHNIILRYLPIEINLIFLWLNSLIDIFVCLHHRGCLHIPFSNVETLNTKHIYRPVTYYVNDASSDRILTMGLGDFFIYDTLLLLVLSPVWLMTTKILVTLGCIVSVQVGYIATRLLFSRLWNNITVPGVPLPVITYSIYVLILDVIITPTSECIQG